MFFKQLPRVAVVDLHGMIMAGSAGFGRKNLINMANAKTQLDTAFKIKRLQAVLLNINSPGGSPGQCEVITDYIDIKARQKSVKVFSFVEDLAASGGYWLACAGEKIYVKETSCVGSIGVISASFGFQELMADWKIERRIIKAGTNKVLNDPFLPKDEEGQKVLNRIIAQIHDSFKNHVKKCRGDRLKGTDEELFNGSIWTGKDAVELGLVDGLHSVHSFINEHYGDDKKVQVKYCKSPGSKLQELFGGQISPLMEDLNQIERLYVGQALQLQNTPLTKMP